MNFTRKISVSEAESRTQADVCRQRDKQVPEELRNIILDKNDMRVKQCNIVRYNSMPRSIVFNIIRRGRVKDKIKLAGVSRKWHL